MLKSLKIQGFQSHRDTSIEFSKNITMFVGSGMSGKTAIFRALNWVINNEPLGFSFLTYGEDRTAVTLVTDVDNNDVAIERHRDQTNNYYKINGDKREANRGNVPEDIANVLNMSEINMQSQFSPYFLVFDSPGKVGQFINDLTGLGDIDQLISKLTSAIKSENSKLTVKQADLEDFSSERKKVDVIDIKLFDDCVNACVELQKEVSIKQANSSIMSNLVKTLTDIEYTLNKYSALDIKGVTSSLSDELSRVAELKLLQSKTDTLEDILDELIKIDTKLKNRTKITIPSNADELVKCVENRQKWRSMLISETNNLEEIEQSLDSKARDLSNLNKEIKEISKSITICPLCKQELVSEDAKRNVGI